MSKFDSDDLGGSAYVLSEDGEFRLRKLRDYMAFLSSLAEPRTADEEDDGGPEVAMGELAFCLQLLAEQADLVLKAVSRPARGKTHAVHAPEPDESADAEDDADDVETHDFSFGVTLDQVDAFNRLTATLSAHGDVVAATETTEFVDHTVPVLGHAIFDDAQAVRDIVRQVETQRLGRRSADKVREAWIVYGAGQMHAVASSAARLH